MRICIILIALLFVGCNSSTPSDEYKDAKEPIKISEDTILQENKEPSTSDTLENEVYSNQRFRDVSIKKLEDNKYRIQGEAQIFEANFGWVVEDGHQELAEGHEMTDAGAPAWGSFDFIIEVEKERENSMLSLILFESSAKDGSRQHELIVPLG